MLENYLVRKNVKAGVKISVNGAVSVAIIALAVIVPQIVHLAAGASGGMTWLPMYAPVLLGGVLLGWKWGLGVGLLAPVVSFAITSAFGSPMPALARLPYMMAELAVFAGVAGAFSKLVDNNAWAAFPAVLIASVSGRAVFMAITAIFASVSPLQPAAVWAQIQSGFIGLILQAVLVPAVIICVRALLHRQAKKSE